MAKHSNFWFETCPPDYRLSTGLPRNVDVVIIGAGVTGVSVLFNLLNINKDLEVVLLEEGAVASHASGRASGQLCIATSKRFSDLKEDIGADNASAYACFMEKNVKLIQRIINLFGFACSLKQTGGLRLAIDEEEVENLKNECDVLNNFLIGTECIWLSEEEIKSIVPSEQFLGGMYIPSEGHLNPYAYVNGMVSKIEESGRRILTGCKVDKVTQLNNTLRVTVRNKGTIGTRHVVYCTNAYSSELLTEFRDFFTPFRGQMLATEPLSENETRQIPDYSMSCNNHMEYFRMYQKRLLLGGMRHTVRDQQRDILFDGENSPTVTKRLREFAQSTFPLLQTKIANVWTGIMCETKDGFPLIGGRPNRPNEWVCAGFNALGISHSLLSGRIIAEYIVEGETSYKNVAKLFDPRRITT